MSVSSPLITHFANCNTECCCCRSCLLSWQVSQQSPAFCWFYEHVTGWDSANASTSTSSQRINPEPRNGNWRGESRKRATNVSRVISNGFRKGRCGKAVGEAAPSTRASTPTPPLWTSSLIHQVDKTISVHIRTCVLWWQIFCTLPWLSTFYHTT